MQEKENLYKVGEGGSEYIHCGKHKISSKTKADITGIV